MTTLQNDEGERTKEPNPTELTQFERRLLDEFQRDFPLVAEPWKVLAQKLEVGEPEIIDALRSLKDRGYIARVGAVLKPNRVGASTLAAMRVPHERLEEVASIINSFVEVNHNYEREHDFNLWFVVGAADESALRKVLKEMEARTQLQVLYLPLVADYHIDLGFRLQWN